MNETNQIPEDEAVYVISVASQLSGLHPQTLRQYDRLGLVSPNRTIGKNRRYSLLDIVKLRNVQRLGIARIMQLEEAVANMALEVAKLRTEVDALIEANPPKSLVRRSEQTVVVYPKK